MPERIEKRIKIEKIDEEQRLVFGWFSVIENSEGEVFDAHGDAISEKVLEDAAYEFNLGTRLADEQHDYTAKGALVESVVFTKAKQEQWGIDLGKVGWWGGFYVDDDNVWEGVKSGKFVDFSIGGMAIREEVDG